MSWQDLAVVACMFIFAMVLAAAGQLWLLPLPF
ncbi:hypothetical protein SMD44_p10178 (plasmid) [Streptomyces alboflavus]|uniref:Uncharacterized protein n=1 Tax=Streptomyces alboflavus TaxID=67267 RepID=A0A291W438_9ACTN|nr:hypothetical protein SMD44_p10178 [Streptomyces alboflavus]